MRIIVDTDLEHLPEIMDLYDQISIQRADSEEGSYTELALVDLQAGKDSYVYYDDEGLSTNWYKTAFYNSSSGEYSTLSEAFAGEGLPAKFGYCFRNYSPLKGIWGEALTADDLRYNYCWGIDMLASDLAGSSVDDEQLKFAVEAALAEFEKHFDIDIRKRIYKTTPTENMIRAPEWQEGVDYTDREMEYDFDPAQWRNYGFIQLRHKPVISIERAELYSAWDQKILDILDWIRLYEKSGQLNIYPKGSTMFGTGYVGSGIIAAMPGLYSSKYPQGFKIDYTTGYETSDYMPNDLRNAIGMLATLNVLGSVGDGLMAGFSSSSVSLDGLSESFSSTQSATSIRGDSIVEGFGTIKDIYKSGNWKGKKILSMNRETAAWEKKEILAAIRHECSSKRSFIVTTKTGEKICVTEDHSLFDMGMQQIKGIDIKPRTILTGKQGMLEVSHVKETKEKWMYDLSIKDNENFLANGILCHNSAYFGARIKSYTDQLKIYINKNKGKYGNLAMGMIKG